MAADTFTYFECFPEHVAEKVHNLASDTLTVALTNTAPVPATQTQLSQITQISSYANLTSRVVSQASSGQSNGDYALVLTDLTLTASGAVDTFRYVVLYNDTASNDELIGFLDYGAGVTMSAGEDFDIDWPAGATIQISIP